MEKKIIIQHIDCTGVILDQFDMIPSRKDITGRSRIVITTEEGKILGHLKAYDDEDIEIEFVNKTKIDKNKWDKLIEKHYLSACKRNPDYGKTRTKEEMKEYWYSMLSDVTEKNVEEFIIGSTNANNDGYFYHPV